MLNLIQKATAQAIVNIFETGRIRGDYSRVTMLAGDSGHLTYGRSQTTLSSGNLEVLLRAYANSGGALSGEFTPYLPALASKDIVLDEDEAFHDLLRRAGTDPTMRSVQDRFFDDAYWLPSVASATGLGIHTGLGVGVVYDGHVHGSFARIKNRTIEKAGTLANIGEETWVSAYVECRRQWLATHRNRLLRKTVYRMDAFRRLIEEERWTLRLPLVLRGLTITESSLTARDSRDAAPERILRLSSPLMRGPAVTRVQSTLGMIEGEVDGIFGPTTERNVRSFQARAGLVADGVVGPATRRALGMVG